MEKDLHHPTSDKVLISKIYKELKKLDIKILNNPIKMSYRTKQRILNRTFSNGQTILKEMFSILSYLGNANQNNYEIPSYTCQNG